MLVGIILRVLVWWLWYKKTPLSFPSGVPIPTAFVSHAHPLLMRPWLTRLPSSLYFNTCPHRRHRIQAIFLSLYFIPAYTANRVIVAYYFLVLDCRGLMIVKFMYLLDIDGLCICFSCDMGQGLDWPYSMSI